MTHAEIIKFYYGHRTDITLKTLANMTGHSISELCTILFEPEEPDECETDECETDETRRYGPRVKA